MISATQRDGIAAAPAAAPEKSAARASDWRPSWHAIAFAIAVVAAGNLLPGAGVVLPVGITFAAAAVLSVSAWLQTDRQNISAYLSLLGLQFVLPASIVALPFRIAVSDFFLIPVLARSAWEIVRYRREWPPSTFRRPLIALVAAFAIATAVGVVRNGVLPAYVWFSKDLGLLFLIGGFFALAFHLRNRSDVMRAIDIVASGAAIVNAAALLAAIVSVTFWPNHVFVLGSMRLYGWMFNPSSYGAFMVSAVLLGLGRDPAQNDSPWRSARRWTGMALMVAAVVLTMSRSVWLCLAAGAAVFVVLLIFDRRARVLTPAVLGAVCAMTLVSAGAMVWIAAANWQQVGATFRHPEAQAIDLQVRMADVCVVHWYSTCGALSREQLEAARQRRARRDAPPGDSGTTNVPVTDPESALLNSRGLTDRAVIASVAWRTYIQSPASMIFGIGLGTFYVTSEAVLSLQLIIHNTAEWFLVELGPLGLFALTWLLASAAMLLWRLRRGDARNAGVIASLAAALTAWAVFSVFNEASYLRHFWFVLACIDRLAVPSAPAGQGPALLTHLQS